MLYNLSKVNHLGESALNKKCAECHTYYKNIFKLNDE